MSDGKSTRTQLVCHACGNQYLVWTYRHVKENRRFCSMKCRYSATLADRFWAKVVKGEGCWRWSGWINESGYGTIMKGRSCVNASRVSWEIHFGQIPSGIVVCHKCDNPECTNPNHLFLGTPKDNNDDKVAKGRQAKGVGHGMSKMTPEIVVAMRIEKAQGKMLKELSAKYGFSLSAISSAIRGATWSHV